MATIKKRSNKRFTAEVRVNGHYQSKTFDSKVQALAWASEIEEALADEGYVTGKTLADLLTRYREKVTPRKKSHYNETNRINRLLDDPISQWPLEGLRDRHFYEWIERMQPLKKTSSINRDLNLFSAVIEQGKRWGWTNRNAVRGLSRPKNPPHRDRLIDEREIERILDALGFDGETVATQRDVTAVAFLFALETAMRQSEIWRLDWQRVFLDKRFVRLPTTKNGSKRDVPLSTTAVSLLKLLSPKQKGKVFKSNQHSSAQIFRRSVRLAGIQDLTFHDTRHEALTRLAGKLEVLDLARMTGHRDPRSLMIYYNATAEQIAQRLD